MKVCLVGSSGGHLTHLYMLKPFWKDKERFWVTFDKEDLKNDNFNGGGTEAIIKPVQDTSSGVGVEKIKGIEAIKNNLQEKAAKKGTYIVQEFSFFWWAVDCYLYRAY